MSLFSTTQVSCPHCGETTSIEEVGSLNADRRPDLRQQILDDTFQTAACSHCGESFRLEPDFNYMDAGRGQWIACYPGPRILDHLEAADEMGAVFENNFGPGAGKAAHELGQSLTGRVVFGWPAMREKLLAHDLAIDDVALELLKLDILRELPEIPLGTGTELRLVEAQGQDLTLAWFGPGVPDAERVMDVELARYQDIVAHIDEWKDVADELRDSPFVDMQKLYMGPGREAAA
ncbi:CpXC domain-containing protein [Pelomonas sp. KK5]|uniref:CpXC domain-containing protein n=1 Tax=Pelomonas sp. KK5 TaxID=1855730 RepID=UPI00097C7F2F|nr:CpXC domain-containing protein [Pelomonas sp. KK5]